LVGILGGVSAPPAPSQVPDLGLFGPDSLTWRIHHDPSMVLGGLRALILQALHPLAMAGVAQFSNYRDDPWGRLQRTAEYVATVTYGTTDEARRAAARVRRVHAGLSGVEPESATPYRVGDPHLLRWVHCAEVGSFLAAYERCGGRLRRGEADAYLAEQVVAGELVGIPRGTVPASRAELTAYLRSLRPELRATAEARSALWFILSPPLPLPARPAWAWLASVAFGLLPRWARALYGLPFVLTAHPGADLAAGLAGRSVRGALALVPSHVRESPARRAAMERLGQSDIGR
jgi:uncharacterized protein (DUF2236 family)